MNISRLEAYLVDWCAHQGYSSPPQRARVDFLGVEPIEILRFYSPGKDLTRYISLGCSRYPMGDPQGFFVDPHGPRAELIIDLAGSQILQGLARTIAICAAMPVVEGVSLHVGRLVDFACPLWSTSQGQSLFSALLLAQADIPAATIESYQVDFLRAIPISALEADWTRLHGASQILALWNEQHTDVTDPDRISNCP